MADMSIQDRYNEISELSGFSEDVVKRVLKACRQSMAMSLKRGERTTLPGICTMTPELRNKIEVGSTTMTTYIKIKSKPSSSMSSELEKLGNFDKNKSNATNDSSDESIKLTFSEDGKDSGIRLTQINALL